MTDTKMADKVCKECYDLLLREHACLLDENRQLREQAKAWFAFVEAANRLQDVLVEAQNGQ